MYYLVKLELRLGEFTKMSSHLVKAENEAHAMATACYGESHNTDELIWDGCGYVEDSCTGIYQVDDCKKLTYAEYHTLNKFIFVYEVDVNELILSGLYERELKQ